jgi:MerR family copper efflux transcriptional regulator
MPTSKLTIGQVAAAAGLTRKAVRVYEAKGLLSPSGRTAAGYRLFDHRDVEVLQFVRRARTLGLHLHDIGTILTIRSDGTQPCAAVRDMLDRRIAEIDETVDELLSLRRSLVGTRRDANDCCVDDAATFCRAIEEPESTSED